MAQTIRQPSTALLTIDSEDRYKDYTQARSLSTSPYDFSISKSESLMPGFMTRVGVSEICFPWTVPNINTKTSQIIYTYAINGGASVNTTITLAQGFYTPSQLATALQVAIRAVAGSPATATVAYGTTDTSPANQPCFTYASGSPTDDIAFSPLPYNSAAYPYSSQSKQLFDVLGFIDGLNTQPQISSHGFYTLAQSIRYVDIVCNQLTNSQAQKDQTSQTVARDMLCRLYIGSASGVQSTVAPTDPTFCPPGCAATVLYRNYAMPKQIQWIPNQNIPGFLQFQVYDDTGDLLDNSLATTFGQTCDWSMTMLVSEN